MAYTLLTSVPLSSILASGPATGTSLNLAFSTVDPINGNYFVASGRDLITFSCSPTSAASVWSSSTVYTQGRVVNVTAGSPAVTTTYIALANAGTNLNQTPASATTFWGVYTNSTVTIYSAPDSLGRKADIVSYVIPTADHAQIAITPSSFYTQTLNQIQFLVTSNLVTVLIQSY
jgi:hypothetical protein